ncbi:MAG: hypothetical protein R3F49_15265, partial [Planctomycetota bacterium]
MRTRLHSFSLLLAAAVVPTLVPRATAEPAFAGQDSGAQGGSPVDDAAKVLRLRQARQTTARSFVDYGKAAFDRADFQGALANFAEALSLDPQNEEARERFRATEDALGMSASQAAESFKDDSQVLLVKAEWARMQADSFSSAGDVALASGKYDDAIQAYRKAEIVLRNYPLIATESLDERIVQSKLQEAAKLRDEAVLEKVRVEREAAAEAARQREQAEADRRENKLRSYYENANRAFVEQNYAQSENWADLILAADPGNQLAR